MEKLKEKDLLEYLEKLGAKEIKEVVIDNWDIHYTFKFSGLKFSIISYNQIKIYTYISKEIIERLKKAIWEIYCYDVNNYVMRSKNLMDFNEFIAECIEIKEKNND